MQAPSCGEGRRAEAIGPATELTVEHAWLREPGDSHPSSLPLEERVLLAHEVFLFPPSLFTDVGGGCQGDKLIVTGPAHLLGRALLSGS